MAIGITTYYIPSEAGGTGRNNLYSRIKVEETWNDSANTSDFTFTYQAKGPSSTSWSLTIVYYTRGYLKVNGTTIISNAVNCGSKTVKGGTEWRDMTSATLSNVSHNSDGSLSLTIGREPISGFSNICIWGYANSKQYFGNCGSGDYTLTCHTNTVGTVKIDNGSSFDSYLVYIDNGSSWDLYVPYEDNGSSWDLCGG